jgi:hypothetical protein
MPGPNVQQLRALAAAPTGQGFAEEKFRLAVESCPSGMVMVDTADQASVAKSPTSMDGLVAVVRDRLSPDRKELI